MPVTLKLKNFTDYLGSGYTRLNCTGKIQRLILAGFIYIMSNPSQPNRLKIGKSKKDPTIDRASELYQTGVPEPFKVEYYAFVEDEDYLEKTVHRYFSSKRPNKDREFFSVDCSLAIEAIRRLSEPNAKIKYEEVFYLSAEELKKTEQRIKDEQLAKEKNLRTEAAIANMSSNLPTIIKKNTANLEEIGDRLIHESLDKKYPEDATKEGEIQVGKALTFLAFPPIAFFWGRREMKRYSQVKNDDYYLILNKSKSLIKALSKTTFSDDWESRLKVKLSQINQDFSREVEKHIQKYLKI